MCHPVHECQISSHTYVEVRWVRDPVLLRQRLDALHLVGLLRPRAHRARRPAPAGRQQKLPLTLEQVLHELGLAVHVGTDLARSSCVRGHRSPTRTIMRTRKVLIFQLHGCEHRPLVSCAELIKAICCIIAYTSRCKPDEVIEGGDHLWSAESAAAVAARRVVAAEGRRRRQQRRERDARSGRIADMCMCVFM